MKLHLLLRDEKWQSYYLVLYDDTITTMNDGKSKVKKQRGGLMAKLPNQVIIRIY